MRFNTLFSLSALLATAGYVAADDEPSDVLSLTPNNFISIVNKEPLILVEFFAPWYALFKKNLQNSGS